MLVSRKVNFFHVVSALLLKNSGLFLGLIRSLIDPTFPLLITFTLYSHFIVRLRVSPNWYKMHCY